MKRIIFILLFALCASGLFAKNKAFYEKNYSVSHLGLYESSNLEETNGYKYYISIYDYMENDETTAYEIFCNDYEKLKDYFFKVRDKGLELKKPYFHFYVAYCVTAFEFYEFISKDTEVPNIKEVYKKKDFGADKKTILDCHICVLE